MKIAMLVLVAGLSVSAQTNSHAQGQQSEGILSQTNQGLSAALRYQKIRMECVEGRRIICGKIVRVLPQGFVIESGYTNLMRPPLDKSWYVPGTVEAKRAANFVEANEPDAVCAGIVFLADLPKSRGKPKNPKLYDYVNLEAFPMGDYTYTSVGTVQHTVRRFTTRLSTAAQWSLEHGKPQSNPPK